MDISKFALNMQSISRKTNLRAFSFTVLSPSSAGNNFSLLFTGHMCLQIFPLIGHFTNWTGYNLLTDNTLKKITQDVLVRCSLISSDHNVKLAVHFQNLVGQCLVTDFYFQHCLLSEQQVKEFIKLVEYFQASLLIVSPQCIIYGVENHLILVHFIQIV